MDKWNSFKFTVAKIVSYIFVCFYITVKMTQYSIKNYFQLWKESMGKVNIRIP